MKLSLCLTNQTPSPEDIRGSAGILPPWKSVAIFKGLPLYHGTHFIEDWVNLRAGLNFMKKRKIS
jgi:hypothetical protein